MQEKHRVSLNAIRVFAIVARTGSLTAAGAELGVTSGAVSHQLKKLEDELGVGFFRRGNNTISLTDVGRRFYEEVAPAIGLIERSADALYRDENEISVHATTSLALRWLIPSLDRFRALCPQVRVRVETSSARGFPTVPDSDVSIRHFRIGEAAEGWEFLARDLRRPVVSPSLLARDASQEIAVPDIPALQCCVGNWDWKLWCETFDISPADLSLAHAFDTDDAALHACVAGLGMLLAPTILTGRETKSGALVTLPGYEPVETGTYRYQRRSESRAVRQFCGWMDTEMRNLE
ncbi:MULTISPECIES: LysR substrate-binding domain-containing protein [Rhizobium]|jgi:DNA-binding transcriptional LysR family regulator|uniref:HTH-type transcriptional regulator TtuA n=1 Tax=Rhizobium lusitanum TaxID=293958 RepID=A0A1C3UQ82_9HYPH|nr:MULTISPECIES: LysR substrate-binding domain-containing protein [Rhizobium]NRP86540.1 HTH-type transcriptional regulator PerR [Ensifer adhaerens]NKJ03585.1 DNA-binding transcriptional LysR family regulator [Rhizobium sp. SG741]NKJ33719.1 DNA-binding transcriptional LysR family regulator [Rhizobium sp. SG570]NTJ08040.1 LysR family transcriptional regulator [Rhizobium lusitanum]SCB17619.1 regulatory helix-turn-helix protein, lysR family [Rhizobium lusitanum]